jgi:Uncharacterised nucleotidyltransferase
LPGERRLLLSQRAVPEDWVSRLRSGHASLVRWLVSGRAPAPDAELTSIAASQGLSARLCRAIDGAPERWPDAQRAALREAGRAGLVRTLRQLDVAARAASLLGAHGLRCLPLKGCAVAEWLYDSPAERSMSDVDLLGLDDWSAGRALLERHGFLVLEEADHAVSLRDPRTGVVVELHRSVTSCPGLFPLDAEGLWVRSREPGDGRPRRPAPEDLLVQLASHATFQHGLVLSLGQYLDFRHLFERCALDLGLVSAAARAARAERLLAPALALASALVAAPVPPELGEWAQAQLSARQRRWLRAALRDPLRFVAPAPASLARIRWVMLQGRRPELLRRTLRAERSGDEGLARAALRAVARAWTLSNRLARERLRDALATHHRSP